MKLLSSSDLVLIKTAIHNVMDTFATKEISILRRNPVTVTYGEGVDGQPIEFPILCLYEPTKGSASRYHTIMNSRKGLELHDGWRIYLWKDDVTALGIDLNPESDQVLIDGKVYQMYMATPSALFSDLQELLYEFEVRFED